ncbi:MAG: radical SAM protein, partial [Deltaproteobacteria bacterium]|nr:radical SAM protein [Deltaproteobacteria bacterium]
MAVTLKEGHQAKVVLVHNKEEYSLVDQAVGEFSPHLVGFTSVSSQFAFVKELAAAVKKRAPRVPIVCGGVHPTLNPDVVVETEALDAVFVGESELAFVDFLKVMENGESYKDENNLAYAEDGKLVRNPLKPLIKNLETLPFPDKQVYPYKETIDNKGHASFGFSRGCPYSCTFCSNHAIASIYGLKKNTPRFRSVNSSIREIEEALSMFPEIKIVYIGDDIFGLNKKWRTEFCREYKKSIPLKFACLLRADMVTEDFMAMLSEAGCYRILFGVESGNEYIRNQVMKKNVSNETIIQAFKLSRKYGIQPHSINMIGLPGETDKMIWDTIRFNRRLKPTTTGVNIFFPYKRTQLGDYCFEQGLVDEELYHNFSNERRETVLKFPEEHKRRLNYYQANWNFLVYPWDMYIRYKRFKHTLS